MIITITINLDGVDSKVTPVATFSTTPPLQTATTVAAAVEKMENEMDKEDEASVPVTEDNMASIIRTPGLKIVTEEETVVED